MDYRKLITDAGFSPDTIGRYKLANLLGCGEKKARRILATLRVAPEKPDVSHEYVGDKWNISLKQTRIHTLEQLIEFFKVDTSQWEVERFICNSWEVGAKGKDGVLRTSPLYQVKATFKRLSTVNIEGVKKAIEQVRREFASKPLVLNPQVFKPSASPVLDQETALEVSVYDAHFGKLAWSDETGWGNYDTSIACFEYEKAVDTILSRCAVPIGKIVYVVGNDILNSDNREGTTTKGTPQSNDSRYHKVFSTTLKTVVKQVEKMKLRCPVDVVMVSGNHDDLSVWHLGNCISIIYDKDDRVNVYNDPVQRKYWQWGKNLVMFEHGDKGAHKDRPLMMAVEQPELWAKTRIREAHVGHLHQERVYEKMGVKVRIIPALCPPDYYHSAHGYVGNILGAQGFIWHKEEGLVGTVEYSIREN
jgi:hypothetical protein